MRDQTTGDLVRVPTQAAGPAATDDQAYRPRHRAVPAAPEVVDTPTVAPPSGTLAAQRKAARAAARTSVVPQQVRRVYDTPAWVPAARPDHEDDSYAVLVDDVPDVVVRPADMIREGRWRSPRRASTAGGFLVVSFLAAAVASGSGLLHRQSTPTLALTLGCLLGAAGVYALLVVLRPVVVELAEPWLSVRHGERHDRFNLASPFQEVLVSGRPGTRSWRLVLGCPDGRVVRVTHRMVDSVRLDVVVRYAQELAAREHAAREERFNR